MTIIGVFLCRYTIVAIVLRFLADSTAIIFTSLAIVGAQARGILAGYFGRRPGNTSLFHLSFVLISNSTNLGDVDAFLHQLGHNLCIACAAFVLLDHETHHLFIAHV